MVNLQKVKKWDILSSEIRSQKFADPQNTRHKRVVEVKILLFNIAYEKAKLQLMNVKRDRLLKKAQQLSSGLQETQMIKIQCYVLLRVDRLTFKLMIVISMQDFLIPKENVRFLTKKGWK